MIWGLSIPALFIAFGIPVLIAWGLISLKRKWVRKAKWLAFLLFVGLPAMVFLAQFLNYWLLSKQLSKHTESIRARAAAGEFRDYKFPSSERWYVQHKERGRLEGAWSVPMALGLIFSLVLASLIFAIAVWQILRSQKPSLEEKLEEEEKAMSFEDFIVKYGKDHEAYSVWRERQREAFFRQKRVEKIEDFFGRRKK